MSGIEGMDEKIKMYLIDSYKRLLIQLSLYIRLVFLDPLSLRCEILVSKLWLT